MTLSSAAWRGSSSWASGVSAVRRTAMTRAPTRAAAEPDRHQGIGSTGPIPVKAATGAPAVAQTAFG
ncbi:MULTISPECIES: hypothetical protein [unclassified Streptomyces]|uniref:hypothetical protein n=1 Tax=unclassified Streptomyces TaxID=2593676 RepID=UPI0015E17AA4|nr:hypothetical protein [Streptomyces sp. SM10]